MAFQEYKNKEAATSVFVYCKLLGSSRLVEPRQGRIQKMNLEGANLGGLGNGSPAEADDFSHLKGYLDVWRDVQR